MKRIKLNFAAWAFLLGTALAFTTSSFTTVKAKTASGATQYQFNGTTLSQDKSASNYSVVGAPPSCSGTALPCTITVSGDLQTWLDARTPAQIRDDADAKRN